jgi:hypothetical protein
MAPSLKTAQLQIRVSAAEKAAIRAAARRAGQDMSTFVLARVLGAAGERFDAHVAACIDPQRGGFGYAELNEYLSGLAAAELGAAVERAPRVRLDAYAANYVAALVESACVRRHVDVPAWVGEIEPLGEPVFGSTLASLRLHLLVNAPAAFRRRNLFVDAGIGDRV